MPPKLQSKEKTQNIKLEELNPDLFAQAIASKNSSRKQKGSETGFKCISLDVSKSYEQLLQVINEFSLRKSYRDRLSIIAKTTAKHWTFLEFSKEGDEISVLVLDAAGEMSITKLVDFLENNGAITDLYVCDGGIQKDGQSCPLFAWDAACQASKIPDLFATLKSLEIEPSEKALFIKPEMLPTRLVRNVQQKATYNKLILSTINVSSKYKTLQLYVDASQNHNKKPGEFYNGQINEKVKNNLAKHLNKSLSSS